MHSPWKRFWLELIASKSWDNGRSVGRLIWVWASLDIGFALANLYGALYKRQEWPRIYHDLIAMAWFNFIVLSAALLLTIYSIFKEKRGARFLALLKDSIKSWLCK